MWKVVIDSNLRLSLNFLFYPPLISNNNLSLFIIVFTYLSLSNSTELLVLYSGKQN